MSNEIEELESYYGFTGRSRRDKALHTLRGILKGIAIDKVITQDEVGELKDWLVMQHSLAAKPPFAALFDAIRKALADSVITADESLDLLWLCDSASSVSPYFDAITHEIQYLHGILHGVVADGIVNAVELRELQNWMKTKAYLCGVFPFDEIQSLLMDILRDGVVTVEEASKAKAFFCCYANIQTHSRFLERPVATKDLSLMGVCATRPDVVFGDRVFCFTGISARGPREIFREAVTERGGVFKNSVVENLNYLVIGSEGNPCWAYACYGRKVESVIHMRKQGKRIILLHENDFWNAAVSTLRSDG